MKRIGIVILFVLLTSILFGELNELRIEGKAKLKSGMIISDSIIDKNMEQAALVILLTDLDTDFRFRSSKGLVRPVKKNTPGRYEIFVSPKEKRIIVNAAGFNEFEVVFSTYGIYNIASGEVYELQLTGDKKVQTVPIMISTTPSDAEVLIDGKSHGITTKGNLSITSNSGEHSIEIRKNGYDVIRKTINVSEGSQSFSYTLEKAMDATVTITSEPEGATIFIKNAYFGNTPKTGFFPKGTYTIKLEKENYTPIVEEITITDVTEKNYVLSDIRASLTINTYPDAKVTVNGQIFTGSLMNQIYLPQSLHIVVEKEFCETITKDIVLTKGEVKQLELFPEDISATLTVKTSPKATVFMSNGMSFIGGLEDLKLLPGTYSLRVEQEYCETITETITLMKGDNKTLNHDPEDVSAYITINTSDRATITLGNGYTNVGPLKDYRINPQMLDIKVEQSKASSIEESILIEKNNRVTLDLYPKVQTATLNVAVIPADANITLVGDLGEEFSHVGRHRFREIPYGTYEMTVGKDDYITHKETITLNTGDDLSRSIELPKAQYILNFNLQHQASNLDMNIKKGSDIIYNGSFKSQYSLAYKGRYTIEINNADGYSFKKQLNIKQNGNYDIDVVNDILVAKQKKMELSKENLWNYYDCQDDTVRSVEQYENIVGILKPFMMTNKSMGMYAPIKVLVSENNTMVNIPLLFKVYAYNDNFLDNKKTSFYIGLSILGNGLVSDNFFRLDMTSLLVGWTAETSDRNNRFNIELDISGKFFYPYNMEYEGQRVSFVKGEVEFEDNELKYDQTTLFCWNPINASVSLERKLWGSSFLTLEAGFMVFTDMGSPEGKYYYKDDLKDWSTGNILPQPIDGDPDHPMFDGFIPYVGGGIRF